MSRTAATLSLRIGEFYTFSFPGGTLGRGEFLGFTDFGWIAMRVHDRVDDTEYVTFCNLANLNALTLESAPGI